MGAGKNKLVCQTPTAALPLSDVATAVCFNVQAVLQFKLYISTQPPNLLF
jgi:hypothetical protein